MRTADYAKRRRVRQLIVVSALSAYHTERNPLALRHYSRMKREADAYVMRRGVPYAILRPGPLSDDAARGAVGLADEDTQAMPEVSRRDVAEMALRCTRSR